MKRLSKVIKYILHIIMITNSAKVFVTSQRSRVQKSLTHFPQNILFFWQLAILGERLGLHGPLVLDENLWHFSYIWFKHWLLWEKLRKRLYTIATPTFSFIKSDVRGGLLHRFINVMILRRPEEVTALARLRSHRSKFRQAISMLLCQKGV